MTSEIMIGMITVVVSIVGAIIGHLLFSVWWASKITTTLTFLSLAVTKISEELAILKNNTFSKEEATRELTKSDEQHKALWRFADTAKERLEKVEREVSFVKGGEKR